MGISLLENICFVTLVRLKVALFLGTNSLLWRFSPIRIKRSFLLSYQKRGQQRLYVFNLFQWFYLLIYLSNFFKQLFFQINKSLQIRPLSSKMCFTLKVYIGFPILFASWQRVSFNTRPKSVVVILAHKTWGMIKSFTFGPSDEVNFFYVTHIALPVKYKKAFIYEVRI